MMYDVALCFMNVRVACVSDIFFFALLVFCLVQLVVRLFVVFQEEKRKELQ